MLTNIMKWVSSAVLLLAGLRLATSYQVLLEIVVCVSGLLVLTQAVRASKYSVGSRIFSHCRSLQSRRACGAFSQDVSLAGLGLPHDLSGLLSGVERGNRYSRSHR